MKCRVRGIRPAFSFSNPSRLFLSLLSTIILTGTLLPSGVSHAQEAPLVGRITWQAASFAPDWYIGKRLPSNRTPVSLSLLLTRAGKVVNPADYTISWSLNNRFVKGGRGVATAQMTPDLSPVFDVAATITEAGGETLTVRTRIPKVQPAVVLSKSLTSTGEDALISIQAIPFFFSAPASQLIYRWTAMGLQQKAAKDTVQVTASLVQESQLPISVTAINSKNSLERASHETTF
jgi:hypothetical protein